MIYNCKTFKTISNQSAAYSVVFTNCWICRN